MAMALVSRGWNYGDDLMHFGFPSADHDETAWGMRLHLPLQLLNGAVARAYRVNLAGPRRSAVRAGRRLS